jgi:hypothetical protein
MRALLLAVLVLAGAAPTVLAFGWGTVGYDVLILERQLEDCPPRGEHPFGGCDQCLAYRYQPLLFLSRVFCGEPGTDWCPIRWEDCDICNGSCAVLWTSGEKKWINVIGDMANVHDTITEWMIIGPWLRIRTTSASSPPTRAAHPMVWRPAGGTGWASSR